MKKELKSGKHENGLDNINGEIIAWLARELEFELR